MQADLYYNRLLKPVKQFFYIYIYIYIVTLNHHILTITQRVDFLMVMLGKMKIKRKKADRSNTSIKKIYNKSCPLNEL